MAESAPSDLESGQVVTKIRVPRRPERMANARHCLDLSDPCFSCRSRFFGLVFGLRA